MGIENVVSTLADISAAGAKTPASKELTLGFKPIEGLKSGDQVIYDGGAAVRSPKKGEVGTVYRVFNPPIEISDGYRPIRIMDFTMLFVDEDGDIFEFGFNSRYFKRKEG